MPECCITDCKSGRKKISRKKAANNPEPEIVQSFPFPTETTARNRWLRQCGLGKNLAQSARICAKHFLDSCFFSPSEARLRLKHDAVPTVFSFGPTKTSSKRRALKHSTTEVTPVPRKIQKIDDHNYSLSPPTVPNFKDRYVIQGHRTLELCTEILWHNK